MFGTTRFSERKAQFLNQFHARLAVRSSTSVGRFVTAPEPRTIGAYGRGKQLIAGNYQFAGSLLSETGKGIWDLNPPNDAFAAAIHGFAWMDDLAAVGDSGARSCAQAWLWAWIERFGKGHGIGWTPELTGRRIIRWINHAVFLLRGNEDRDEDAFYRSLRQQTRFLSRRWHVAAPGVARFEALTGLIYAGLALDGLDHLADPAIKALATECAEQINDQGGLATRNPEELLSVFTLLTWAAAALSDAGRGTPRAHLDAIERIAPALRTLRHADGGLARFHGGGRGAEGWLDYALASSGSRGRLPEGLSMGYARMSAGRSSVIIDASAPPSGAASYNAHASCLAFELTSGRRPLIVNCGSGVSFGSEWRRAGRATPSHSALSLGGYSSARLEEPELLTGRELLIDGPTRVPVEISAATSGRRFRGGHDGYVLTHGLTHARTLELALDGRTLSGEDMLVAMEEADQRRFNKISQAGAEKGVRFEIRFHLHPEVDATLDLGGAAVSMALKSGEIWVFRHDGAHQLTLEPSVYLETTRLKPRPTQQIVLTGWVRAHTSRVNWTLSKAQETAIGVRDLALDDPYASEE